MSYLAKKFVLFLCALGVLFGSVFISFRCGYSSGLKDAPRHFYSVDIRRSLETNADFKNYVDSLYHAAIDSVIRRSDFYSFVGQWLDSHPGCALQKMSKVPGVTQQDYERVFYKGVKF